MLKKLHILLLTLLAAVCFTVTAWADYDYIEQYGVMVTPNTEDGSLLITVKLEWTPLEELPYGQELKIGVPNGSIRDAVAQTDNIERLDFDNSYMYVYLDRGYDANETFSFAYSWVQEYMYRLDGSAVTYDYTAGWFDEAGIGQMTPIWNDPAGLTGDFTEGTVSGADSVTVQNGMTITASKGTKWMNMLSNIAVPIVLIFGFISIIRAFNDVGGVAGINALVKEDSITFAKAVALGVGSYVVGSVMFTPDIMRFAKNAKTSIIVMIITIMVGNSFMVFFGAIGSVVYGDPDIMGVLALQGLLAPAFIVMVLNIWSTAQGCVYSGSMSLSSVIKVPRNKLTLVFGLVGTILGCVGFYNLFGSYINFLSSTVPPIVGIVFADFLTKYNHGYTDLDSLPRADIGGFVSWIVGVAVTFIPVLLPSINCVVVAFLVKVIFNKVGKKQ